MKRYFTNYHSITLQHDSIEREAREMLLSHLPKQIDISSFQLDVIVKLVKAAYQAGQDSILAEINDGAPEDAPKLSMCRCGHSGCMTVQFSNMGKFNQGTGFTMREALRMQDAWLLKDTFDAPTVNEKKPTLGVVMTADGERPMTLEESMMDGGDPWAKAEAVEQSLRNKARNHLSKLYPKTDLAGGSDFADGTGGGPR